MTRKGKPVRETASTAAPSPSPPLDTSELEDATTKADTDEPGSETRSRSSRSREQGQPQSADIKAIRLAEDASLRDILEAIGSEGSYKITLKRLEPDQFRDPHTGTMVKVSGHLKNYFSAIDEEAIAKTHGGGKFSLWFYRKSPEGSWRHFAHRTIEVAGDPRTDDVNRTLAPVAAPAAAAPATAASESPSLAMKAFSVLEDQLRQKRDDGGRVAAGMDPAMQQVIQLLQQQLDASNRQLAELRKELMDARNVKPPEDPLKDKLLEKMIDGDNARITSLRATYDSEIRQIKDNHQADIKRIEDRFDRTLSDAKATHLREIDLLKQSHDVALKAIERSNETNIKLAEYTNKRLEAENVELRADNKELRAKKEKGIIETIKEMDSIKEVLGVGDDGDKSTTDRVLESLPGMFEAAKAYMAPKAPPPQQAQTQAVVAKRRIVRTPDGKKFVQETDGSLRPVTKKTPEQHAAETGQPIPIDPATVTRIIDYMEKAFVGGQDPAVVAQSSRAMVPEEILAAIRDSGVDDFLAKVAKLPSTSPLATQAGKNWARKLGKVLTGEEE